MKINTEEMDALMRFMDKFVAGVDSVGDRATLVALYHRIRQRKGLANDARNNQRKQA